MSLDRGTLLETVYVDSRSTALSQPNFNLALSSRAGHHIHTSVAELEKV